MPSQSVQRKTRLLLVLASCASLVAQACGGKSEKGSNMNGGDAAPTGGTPELGDTSKPGATADDPAVVSTSPFSSSPCATSEWKSCTLLGGKIESYFVAVDADDHLLLAGSAQLSPPDEARTAFVAKYSVELELIWLRQLDSSLLEVQGLAADARGNCFVAGRPSYNGSSTIVEVSGNGALLWTQPYPGVAVSGLGLAVDGDGDVVIAGSDKSTLRLAKYSPDGEQLWEVARPSAEREIVNHVAADAQGDTFLAADRALRSGSRWWSGDLEKHAPNGELEWTMSLDGALVSGVSSTAAGEASVLLGIPSVALVRVSAAGEALLRKDLDHFALAYGLASDSDGDAWVTGYTADIATMGSVVKYSPEADSLFSKDFALPSFVGSSYVAQMSDGKAYIVGPETYESGSLAIAQLQP